jgi:hypothetical protein
MKVNVHIERLVLDGLPITSAQGPRVRHAVERELTRLLGVGGLSGELRAGGAVPSVRAGGFEVARENHPTGIGRQIARAVYGGIGSKR